MDTWRALSMSMDFMDSIAMGKKRDTDLSGRVTLTVRKAFLMTTTVSRW